MHSLKLLVSLLFTSSALRLFLSTLATLAQSVADAAAQVRDAAEVVEHVAEGVQNTAQEVEARVGEVDMSLGNVQGVVKDAHIDIEPVHPTKVEHAAAPAPKVTLVEALQTVCLTFFCS